MKKLNSLYFSARLQRLLAQLSSAGTTLVVAPMGYGKTLALDKQDLALSFMACRKIC